MSHAVNIPIRFQFLRTPCMWEIRTVMRRWAVGEPREPVRMLFPTIDPRLNYQEKPRLLDGWECRDEFFKLSEDENSLLGFLAHVGVWTFMRGPTTSHWSKEVMRHAREGHPLPIPIEGIWGWRKELANALVEPKKFAREMAAAREPQTLAEALWGRPRANKFSLSFELERDPQGVVTVTNAHHMLLTTVYVDIVRGFGFKYCRRSDCKAPFAVTNNHEKFYCSLPCAHLENVRKKRREAREAREKAGRGGHQ